MANDPFKALKEACAKPIAAMHAFIDASQKLRELGYHARNGKWTPVFDMSYTGRLEGENKALMQLASQANVRAGQAEASFKQLSGQHLRATTELRDARRTIWMLVRSCPGHSLTVTMGSALEIRDDSVLETHDDLHGNKRFEALTAEEQDAKYDDR